MKMISEYKIKILEEKLRFREEKRKIREAKAEERKKISEAKAAEKLKQRENKPPLRYAKMREKNPHSLSIEDMIEIGEKKGMHYCIKIGIFVKVCRAENCNFHSYKCPATVAIIKPEKVKEL